ncbi:hypothetical protein GP486_007951 [Trichoglossum hirsutum]|uniref:Uncharacterized protein n=1 Tax=Trichoglossum hirsutum TaxID=265104 RepID=A0A9P8IJ41_9PEZI|nr:hypothetical protein GP486_007951 [Trichoglossum hirsutum]
MYDTQGKESEETSRKFDRPPAVFSTSTSGTATEEDTPHPSPTAPAMPQATARLEPNQSDTLTGHYTSEYHQTDGPCPQTPIDSLHPPPVTARTLSELDIQQIVNNPKLRHDVGFDPNLHFRPNLDGEKGRRKRQQNEAYWVALHDELQQYLALGDGGHGGRHGNLTCASDWTPKKIPAVFGAIREILKTLVPDRDHSSVDQNMDVPLLMQQLKRDVLDVYRLAVWMGQLLKGHCAPMRDGWVDDMVAQIEFGTKNGCTRSLVGGLKSLFGILETMKLDVANHQIRNLRVMLIAETVEFEQNYFGERILEGRVDARSVYLWYRESLARYRKANLDTPVSVFLRALIHTLMPRSSGKLPASFVFDLERLELLRTELREVTCFKVCYTLFLKLLLKLKCQRDADISVVQTLRSRILLILGSDGFEEREERWNQKSVRVAHEIVRFAQEFAGADQWQLNDDLVDAQAFLCKHVRQDSSVFQALEWNVENAVWKLTTEYVELFSKSSPLTVVERWVFPTRNDRARTHWKDVIPSIAKRLARIGHLHWQVWGPLVYMQPE